MIGEHVWRWSVAASIAAVALTAHDVLSVDGHPPPQSPTVAAGDVGAISGVVREGGGSDEVGEAVVSIEWASGAGFQLRQTTSDRFGRFVFMSVPSSDLISIHARKTGYVDGEFGQRAAGVPGLPVSLRSGQWLPDLSLPLWPNAAIEGRVVDESSQAVIGATVRVIRLEPLAGSTQFLDGPAGQTDDRGVYRIGGLAPGRYIVGTVSEQMAVPAAQMSLPPFMGTSDSTVVPSVAVDEVNRVLLLGSALPIQRAASAILSYSSVYYLSARSLREATAISLVSGQTRSDVDLQLIPAQGFRVSGVVQGPTPVPGGLNLRLIAGGDDGLGLSAVTAFARVGSDGAFDFIGVPPGDYVLEAAPSTSELRWGSLSGPGVPTMPAESVIESARTVNVSSGRVVVATRSESEQGNAWWARQAVQVGSQDLRGLVVTMRPSSSLSGRVAFETGDPAQTRSSGSITGAIGVGLFAEPADGRMELGEPAARTSPMDPMGNFTLRGLLPGKYILRTTGGEMVKSVEWQGNDYSNAPFEVTTGSDFDGVMVTVTAAAAGLAGTVTDPSGIPTPGVAVTCFPAEPEQWHSYGLEPRRIRSVRSSTAGQYRMDRLPAGDYLVVALPADTIGRWREPGFLATISRVAVPATLRWSGTAMLNLVTRQVPKGVQ